MAPSDVLDLSKASLIVYLALHCVRMDQLRRVCSHIVRSKNLLIWQSLLSFAGLHPLSALQRDRIQGKLADALAQRNHLDGCQPAEEWWWSDGK
jgi:hypothetical protein